MPSPSIEARIAAAVLDVDGVVALHGGTFGEVATYLPGERITGVRLGSGAGEVHVVASLRRDLRAVGEQVRVCAEELAGMPVTVTIEDIAEEAADE